MIKAASSIRFDERTDSHLLSQVVAEQRRRGDTTTATTARDLLKERLSQLETRQQNGVDAAPSSTGNGAANRIESSTVRDDTIKRGRQDADPVQDMDASVRSEK